MSNIAYGYFNLPRELTRSDLWRSIKPTYRTIFTTLVDYAVFYPARFDDNGQIIELKPGQMCCSIRKLADMCGTGFSKNIVASAIKWMVSAGWISQEIRHRKSVITITEPDTYAIIAKRQSDNDQTTIRQRSDNDQTQSKKETKQECKERKKELNAHARVSEEVTVENVHNLSNAVDQERERLEKERECLKREIEQLKKEQQATRSALASPRAEKVPAKPPVPQTAKLLANELSILTNKCSENVTEGAKIATTNTKAPETHTELSRARQAQEQAERRVSQFFASGIVPPHYMNASLGNCVRQTQEFVEFGKEWAKNPTSLYLYGANGRGKTHYAFALIREMLMNGKHDIWPRYFTSTQLDQLLLPASKSEEGDKYEIQKYGDVDLLFIDDLGKETHSERTKRQYTELFNYRYVQNKPTIVTSNYTMTQIGQMLDPAIASRMSSWKGLTFMGIDLRRHAA